MPRRKSAGWRRRPCGAAEGRGREFHMFRQLFARAPVLLLVGGVLGTVLLVAAGVGGVLVFGLPSRSREPLRARLDPAGPYLILASRQAAGPYAPAIARAKGLHPD